MKYIRLKKILSTIPSDQRPFYDLYCDHGKLGIKLHQRDPHRNITFIDIKEHLIEKIRTQYKDKPNLSFQAIDATKLTFPNNGVIAMCGVGGHLIKECIKNYSTHKNYSTLTFIISANIHHLELRKFLIDGKAALVNEEVFVENNRCYEVFTINYFDQSNQYQPMKLFNPKIWEFDNKYHSQYLHSKLKDLQQKKQLLEFEQKAYIKIEQFLQQGK